MNIRLLLIVLTVLVLSIQTTVQGQSKRQAETIANCEDAQSVVSIIHNLRVKDNLIVISRLGRKETNTVIGRRRLKEVRSYLEKAWKRDPETIILAEGEKASGLGRLDFYVSGTIIDSLFVAKNKNISFYCR